MPVALKTLARPEGAKPSKLRSDKKIPAVVYGQGMKNVHCMMDYETFRKAFDEASFSVLVNLETDDKKTIPTLIHEVQYDPVTDKVTHVDFYAVAMDKKVKTHIPLEFTGASEAVKLGAVLSTVKHDLEVSCLPGNLVRRIQVDLSQLQKIGDAIHVKDLKISKDIEVLNPPDEQIVSAIELKIIVEEVAAPVASVAEGAPVAGAEGAPVAGAEGAPAEGTAGGAKGAPAEGNSAKGEKGGKPDAKKDSQKNAKK